MKHLLFANVKRGTALLLAILFAATAALTGCSSDSYDEPSSGAISNVAIEGHATNVVIEPATLKGWMDAGLINAPNSFDGRVVILDVTEEALYYSKGHIPGAQLWNMSENYQNRVEGPALSAEMVLDGPSMDKMLQKHGIDERTTIVITSSFNETHKVLRAYAQFRYWGFPKERLKVLNGFNGVWPVDQLTVEVPVVAPSTYSVRQLGTLRSDLRTSLSEMIVAVRSGSHQPIDFRGTAPPFSTPGVFSDVAGDYVVFEGLVVGGKTYDWKKFNVDYAAGKAASGVGSAGFQFKSAADIAADLALAGIDNSKPIITSCRSGNIASAAFFALDAILGWNVSMYDASWSQWGQMSANAAKGGKLPAGSIWATDVPELTNTIAYNTDAGRTIEVLPINAQAQALYPDPSQPEANQIELEDAAYMQTSDDNAGGAPGATSGGGGGGC